MRRHLTYANVMSTLGVFMALAGGFAIGQIGGQGSVRSGQLTNLNSDFARLVAVPGLGKVTGACINDVTRVAWENTSNHNEQVSVEFDDHTVTFKSMPGESHDYALSIGEAKLIFQVARTAGADAPQTVASVFGSTFTAGDCAENVAAEAISTK